jgi:hypothetical protein
MYKLFLAFFFLGCNSLSNDNTVDKKDSDFTFSDIKIIYKLNEIENYKLKVVIDTINPMLIDTVLANNKKLFSLIETELKNLNEDKVRVNINKWRQIENTIILIQNDSEYDLMAFFYNDKSTNFIFNKYIVHPEQDWGSLSSSQYYSVFDDIVLFLYKMNNKNRFNFISKLINHIQKDSLLYED